MYVDTREIDFLDKQQAKLLIDKCENLKHKLILLLMLDCGLRVSETISLKISNFDFKKKILYVQSLKKREKKKIRAIPLSNRLYECLALYIQKNSFELESFIFPNKAGGHISRFAVNRICDRNSDKLNIDNLHPHALRHTFATQHLASGTPLENIKEFLGHVKYDTTLIYSHIPSEVLKKNIAKVENSEKTFLQKFREILLPTSNRLINISANPNALLIGREDTCTKVKEFADKDINCILIGGIGSGKSTILNHLTFKKKILKFDDTDNIKKSLLFLLIYLYKNDKKVVADLLYGDFDLEKIKTKLSRESAANLCDEIKRLVNPKEYILLIDNVDSITPKSVKVLEELKDTFTIVTSAREIPINKSSFLWNFEKIEVKNLERKHALDLINKLSYDLDVEDYELFRNHIFEQSDGNPRVIFELVDRYRKEPVITNEVVRSTRHFGSMKEIDMTLLILVALGSVAILKYLSHEVGNDSYRFIGGLAMVLLIISRYFFKNTKRKFL